MAVATFALRVRQCRERLEVLARTYKRDKDGKFSSGGGGGIRESLAAADSPQAVADVLSSELRGLTGRDVPVDFTGADVAVARGYAEGILRGQERFPAAPLTRVMTSDDTLFAEMSRDLGAPRTEQGSGMIVFNRQISSSPQSFDAAVADLRRDNLAMAGTDPTWVGLHEMAHVVDNYATPGKAWPHQEFTSRESTRLVREQMQSEGLDGSIRQDREAYVERAMSAKAAQTPHELVAEAVADSMLSGERAAPLSRRITAALDADYQGVHSGAGQAHMRLRTPLAQTAGGAAWPPCDTRDRAGAAQTLNRTYKRDREGKFSSGGGGDSEVRQSLAEAGTTEQVGAVLAAELRGITGRTTRVDLTGSDVQIAREHAEGLLRAQERYPGVRVDQVVTYGPGGARDDVFADPRTRFAYAATGIAPTEPDGVVFVHTIGFSAAFSGDPDRYRTSLDNAESDRYTVRGGPLSTAVHEFGHRLAADTASATQSKAIASDSARAAGQRPSDHIREQVSAYAATSAHELTAEAFTDVMLHGDGASPTSQAIMAEVDSRASRQGLAA